MERAGLLIFFREVHRVRVAREFVEFARADADTAQSLEGHSEPPDTREEIQECEGSFLGAVRKRPREPERYAWIALEKEQLSLAHARRQFLQTGGWRTMFILRGGHRRQFFGDLLPQELSGFPG